jgi:transposase
MGWFFLLWKNRIILIEENLNAIRYQQILNDFLLIVGQRIGGDSWILVQDNAPCHRAAATKQWLHRKNVKVLNFPARSPDLNPIEKLWRIRCIAVYKDRK